MTKPSFAYEQKLWERNINVIAGLDEVGKGAFAGPIVAAAVILPREPFEGLDNINDSKLLQPKKREKLSEIIKKNAISYAITEVSVAEIDQIGISRATFRALSLAAQQLNVQAQHFLVDGYAVPDIARAKQTPLISGDRKSYSIAAASIIAKVYRDTLMTKLDIQFQKYKFDKHKGYGTLEHRQAIKQFGLCPLHRTSFDLHKFL